MTWLYAPGSARHLAALRIGLCLLLAVRIAVRPNLYLDLADKPDELFQPVSYTELLSGWPSHGVLLAVMVAAVLLSLLAAAGAAGRVTVPLALACSMFLNGLVASQGKVIHPEILLTLCLLALVPARHSDVWSVDALRARRRGQAAAPDAGSDYGWPVRTMALLVCGSYLFAGAQKLSVSGLDWATSDNLRWVLYSASDRQGGNDLGLFFADRPLLAHVMAWSTLALECGFVAVLLHRRLRLPLVLGAAGLHLGVMFTMDLYYAHQALIAGLVLLGPTFASDQPLSDGGTAGSRASAESLRPNRPSAPART